MENIRTLTDQPQKHRASPAALHSARVFASWPPGTFVENLLVRETGEIIVSIHSENRLDRVSPLGEISPFAEVPSRPTSLMERNGRLFGFGGVAGEPPGYLWEIDSDSQSRLIATFPDARLLNGSVWIDREHVVVADSFGEVLYIVNPFTGEFKEWLRDPRLGQISTWLMLPGANGVGLFDGAVYVSNTNRAELYRIPIRSDGSAGPLEVLEEHLRADDFTFDSAGNLYYTTHIENTLERRAPTGERHVIVDADQGMPGSTSVRFGRDQKLYVTTTGGVMEPYLGETQRAKLIQVDLEVNKQ